MAGHARIGMMVGGCVLVGGCATQRGSWVAADERPKVEQTIDAWHDAAARGDFHAYFSRMTRDAVFLGTDATERWTRPEFEAWTGHPGGDEAAVPVHFYIGWKMAEGFGCKYVLLLTVPAEQAPQVEGDFVAMVRSLQ